MTAPIYLYRIRHRPASSARVMINGIGVYDRTPLNHVTPMQPINHWLVQGENTITIELLPAPRSPNTPLMDAHFMMELLTADDQDRALWKWEYPQDVLSLGLPIDLPRLQESVFPIEHEMPAAPYLRATPEEFPIEGTLAQHEAVRELHEAFAARDEARFAQVMDLKAETTDRFYGASPRDRAEAMEKIREPWIMEPFVTDDLRFDRYAGGRVAYVRRLSGRPPVKAVHRDEPYLGFGSNFYMTCLEGRWRIFW